MKQASFYPELTNESLEIQMANLEATHQEFEYFHPTATKKGKYYEVDARHPLITKINPPILADKNGKYLLSKFELQMLAELVALEYGKLIINE